MKKYLLALVLFLVIILPGCGNNNTKNLNESKFIGQIYHAEIMGHDAADVYRYYIYPDGNNFMYIKTSGMITEAGEEEGIEVKRGKIKTKKDLINLDKDIENDKKNDADTDISYFYREEDGIDTRYDSIEALTDRIFNERG